MTREEAIIILENNRPSCGERIIFKESEVYEAMSMAIEALSSSEIPNSSDSISRQAAIDAVKKNTFRLTFAEEQNCEGHVAWSAEAVYSDVMEGALLELPSAQPDQRSFSWGQENDVVSRQWLMECVNEGWIKFDTEKDENRFVHLVRDIAPSAQPEIIRCKDCKHYDGRPCGIVDWYNTADDFCSRAERKDGEAE